MSILAAILIFAILVIIHEFGHFIAAKWSGVRVQEFAIGFPPRLWSVKRGETQYSINVLPLGGYVLMPGENGELTDENGQVDPRSFAVQPAKNRALILVAGVVMNFLLAIVVYAGIYAAVGVPNDHPRAIVDVITANSPAQVGGLQHGDEIISINGMPTHSIQDALNNVNKVIADDKSNSATVPVTFVVKRHGEELTLNFNARRNPAANQGHIGFSFDAQAVRLPFWQLPGAALNTVAVGNFQLVGEGFHQILIGTIKPTEAFSGPVGIVRVTSDVASNTSKDGYAPLFNIMAFLSWNLAVFNLLPIPGLDGGRLLILGIEVLRRGRRLAPQREMLINLAGLGFLLSLIVIFTINDISQIIGGH